MRSHSGQSNLGSVLLILSCLIAALTSTVSADEALLPGTDGASNLSCGSDSVRAEDVFMFPDDHVLHQPQEIVENIELFLEWLYWTGILRDIDTGDLYGVQYTLFHQNLQPGMIGYVNHAAISDVRNSQHPRYRYITLPDQADITDGIDTDMGAYWRYQDNQTALTYWKDMDAWNIVTLGNASSDGGHGQNISLNLTLVNDNADYYLHRPCGIGDQGACQDLDSEIMAGKSYYYSHPSMTTTGTLTIDGRKIDVQGESWFDHQWGGFGKCYPAWDWFSLRLDDGSFVMLYNLKDPQLNDLLLQRGLTYIDSGGNVTWWYGEDAGNLTATRWWKSDLFGFRYPLDWVIDTPAGKYALQPYFDEQIMNAAEGEIKYWEGIMRVRDGDLSGEQIGMCYMELAGYAPISSQTVEQNATV
jgi:predicted secreted hydrolase